MFRERRLRSVLHRYECTTTGSGRPGRTGSSLALDDEFGSTRIAGLHIVAAAPTTRRAAVQRRLRP